MTQQDTQNLSNSCPADRFKSRPKALKELFETCGAREIQVSRSLMPHAIPSGSTCILKTVSHTKLKKGDLLVFKSGDEGPEFRRFLAHSGSQLITTIDGTGQFLSHDAEYVQKVEEIRMGEQLWQPNRYRDLMGRLTDYGTRKLFTRPL